MIRPLVYSFILLQILCVTEKEKQNGDEVPPAKRRKEKGSQSPAEGP